MSEADFLIRAWRVANDKAREFGWIVRGDGIATFPGFRLRGNPVVGKENPSQPSLYSCCRAHFSLRPFCRPVRPCFAIFLNW
jgi:hypothetical protein